VPPRCPLSAHASTGISYILRPKGIAGEDAPQTRDLFHQKYRGSRYSFGYPPCPNLEDQTKLFALLRPEPNVGVRLTRGSCWCRSSRLRRWWRIIQERGISRSSENRHRDILMSDQDVTRESRSSRQFLQNAYTSMTTPGRGWGIFTHRSSRWGRFSRLGGDRRLHAPRHRAGMGKNWRSYRRGCERRFIFPDHLRAQTA